MVKDVLKTLSAENMAALRCAFEDEVTHYIELPDGFYVGVNAHAIPGLIPISIEGYWSYGRIQK